MTSPEFPFGKHAGKPLTEIPSGYLRWFEGVSREQRQTLQLRLAVLAELERRREVRRASVKPSERISREAQRDPNGRR